MSAVVALCVVVVVGGLWFVRGRDPARALSDSDALSDFREGGGAAVEGTGGPAAGVYAATASGNESIGLPGFDESLGPSAPVTVTYDDTGCFTYRADFNSHHWRSWTFCPGGTATFALQGIESWTARKAPGMDVATLSTYDCDTPIDFLWSSMAAGDRRTGACTGTTDADDSVTDDAATMEVLDTEDTVTIAGEEVSALRISTSDALSGAQTGSEHGEWWLDPATGLPLRVSIESALEGGLADYSEQFDLVLSTLTPAT
ncbi:MAG: hypothetical protein M5U19_15850 [Microthrixaceae bacterium]|nr:hypothetical protein [Microthrixaceae bacterium]